MKRIVIAFVATTHGLNLLYMYVGFICILSKINALKDNKGQNKINMHA